MKKTRVQRDQIPINIEWVSKYADRAHRRRKVKRNPVLKFLFWSAMVLTTAIISARLAALIG